MRLGKTKLEDMKLSTRLHNVFRANVAALLQKYGWTQSDLAVEMGVTKGYVSQVMTGRIGVGLEAVDKFAGGLQVSPSSLIDEKKAATKAG